MVERLSVLQYQAGLEEEGERRKNQDRLEEEEVVVAHHQEAAEGEKGVVADNPS